MKVTLEQVEHLRKRVDCDYQTAEKVLRKTGGNEDQAVLYILKRREHRGRKLLQMVHESVTKVLGFQLVLLKNKKTIVKMPIVLLAFIVLFFDVPMGFLLALAVVAILLGYEFEVYYKNHGFWDNGTDDWEEVAHGKNENGEAVEPKGSVACPSKAETMESAGEKPGVDMQQDYEEIIIE